MDEMNRPDGRYELGRHGILAFNMGESSPTNMGGAFNEFHCTLNDYLYFRGLKATQSIANLDVRFLK